MKTMKRNIIEFGSGKIGMAAAGLTLVAVVMACGDRNSSPVGPSSASAPDIAVLDDTASFSAFGRTVNSTASGSGGSGGGSETGSGSESSGSEGSTDKRFICPSGSIGTPLRLNGFIQAVDGNTITVKGQSVEIVEGETALVSRVEGVTLTLEMLEAGLPVRIDAMMCDGTATATRVILPEEFEVTGVIFMIGSNGTNFTLLIEGLPEGLHVELGPDTEVDEALCLGDVVEVRVRVVTSDGLSLLARKVELEASMSTDRTCSPTIEPTRRES